MTAYRAQPHFTQHHSQSGQGPIHAGPTPHSTRVDPASLNIHTLVIELRPSRSSIALPGGGRRGCPQWPGAVLASPHLHLLQPAQQRRGPGITDEALERWHDSFVVHQDSTWPTTATGEAMFNWEGEAGDDFAGLPVCVYEDSARRFHIFHVKGISHFTVKSRSLLGYHCWQTAPVP